MNESATGNLQKKIYHASDFGVNPEDYGMTKEQFSNYLITYYHTLTYKAREFF